MLNVRSPRGGGTFEIFLGNSSARSAPLHGLEVDTHLFGPPSHGWCGSDLGGSVVKTGRAAVINEGNRTCGVASEVIARLNEKAFGFLEAPIKRLTSYDIQFPYFACEQIYLPDADRIANAAMQVMEY